MNSKRIKMILSNGQKSGSRHMDRLKYIARKTVDRTKDSFFNFTHAHLIRNMVTAAELDLVKREPCDKDLVFIAFYPTGGFGDYMISSKLLDEILLSIPCRIDVYCENIVFGRAVYAARPAVRVLAYESLYANRSMYDVVFCVEHFIHVKSWNAHRVAKIAPAFADKVSVLGKSMQAVCPEIGQQWFREALHFQRSRLLGINRWTELRHGSVFTIPDQYTYVRLHPCCLERVQEIGLENCRYLTVNRGADSMGRSGMQTKVWPLCHYEALAVLLKKRFPDIKIIQLGSKGNKPIAGADMHLLEEDMEVTKWLLRGSLLHIDCEGGLVHLATQLAVKCIVLFGPTPLHTYAYPQNTNLVSEKCSGCMGLHPDWAFSCYRGLKQPECMYSLTPETVMASAQEHLCHICGQEKTGQKKLTRICAASGKEKEFRQLYQACRKKLPFFTMRQAYAGVYAEILEQAGKLKKRGTQLRGQEPPKIALIYAKRDYIGWYLQSQGFAVTVFDPDYGYSGRTGDTTFNRFTAACAAHGMDMRLGDGLQIPYASEYFDITAVFCREPEKKGYTREAERILKPDGCLIWIGEDKK
ncbi:MAG: hypothetical protein K2N87_16515 [Eubacterium sp.]|nr:hypothetical protein [Eubacterium sp.]